MTEAAKPGDARTFLENKYSRRVFSVLENCSERASDDPYYFIAISLLSIVKREEEEVERQRVRHSGGKDAPKLPLLQQQALLAGNLVTRVSIAMPEVEERYKEAHHTLTALRLTEKLNGNRIPISTYEMACAVQALAQLQSRSRLT